MPLRPLILSILLLFAYLLHPTNAEVDPSLTQGDAKRDMSEINDVYWSSCAAYRKFSDNDLSPETLMREKLRPHFNFLSRYDWHHFNDTQLKRQFEVLLRGKNHPPVVYKFKKATKVLKSMSRQKWACDRKQPAKCNMAMVHQIKSIITNSNDFDEILYYWKEWRNKMPEEVKQALHSYVAYYQGIHNETDKLKPSAVWYDQYEDPHFIKELEQLMNTIRPFYQEMHAHIRNQLRLNYGADIIPKTGLIPHHLFEQVTYQAWKKESILKIPMREAKMPNLQADIDAKGYSPFDLVKISAQYFGSMGFGNLTEEFMRDHFIEMEAGTGGPDCKSTIFDYCEVELHYCPKVYYKKLLQTHGDMARVQYAILKNQLKVGLNQEACPGFGNALGEAVILSVSNPKHIQRMGLAQNYEYNDFLNLHRLYRLAVHSLLTIPTYFVHEKLWVDMIDGNVAPSEYNCHYWNLMEKYLGVQAPVKTADGAYDMPYKFYEGIIDQYRSTKKIFGEFLGYQIYRAICLNIGEFERRNAYKTLDNCDFAGNKQAGKLLHDMMSAGSSKSWRELIKPLTIRQLTNLTATAFLEYFEPLNTWISDQNSESGLNAGWMSYDNCKFGVGAEPSNASEVFYW